MAVEQWIDRYLTERYWRAKSEVQNVAVIIDRNSYKSVRFTMKDGFIVQLDLDGAYFGDPPNVIAQNIMRNSDLTSMLDRYEAEPTKKPTPTPIPAPEPISMGRKRLIRD